MKGEGANPDHERRKTTEIPLSCERKLGGGGGDSRGFGKKSAQRGGKESELKRIEVIDATYFLCGGRRRQISQGLNTGRG